MAPGKGATTAKAAKKQKHAVTLRNEGSQPLQNEQALRTAAAVSAGMEPSRHVLVSSRNGGVDQIAPTPGVGQGAAGPGDSNNSDGAESHAETGAGMPQIQHVVGASVHTTVARLSGTCWIDAAVKQREEKGEVCGAFFSKQRRRRDQPT